MDPTMKMKAIGAGVLFAGVMALAVLNKITGAQAVQALEGLGAAWFGATALLGSAHLISSAMVTKTSLAAASAAYSAAKQQEKP